MAKIHLCLLFGEKKQLFYANKEIYCLMFFLCEGEKMQRTEETDTMTLTFGKRKEKKSPATCSLNTVTLANNWFCLQFRPGPLGAPAYCDAAVSLQGSHSD